MLYITNVASHLYNLLEIIQNYSSLILQIHIYLTFQ